MFLERLRRFKNTLEASETSARTGQTSVSKCDK